MSSIPERDPEHMPAYTPRFTIKGITGTNVYSGSIVGKEQNPKLTGKSWVLEAESMLSSDPIVRRSWTMLRQTLLSASWRFESANVGDPVCDELARFANECYGFDGYSGQMSLSWEQQLSYLWEFVPLGYRYAEEVYRVGPDANGKIKVWLDRYADREPSAHQKWLSRDGQQLDGVYQDMVGKIVPEPIPSNKMILLTLNKTGSNFEGVGMLRSCWWWWRTKQRVSNMMLVGLDRWAVPTPKVTVDRSVAEQQGYTQSDIEAMIDEAEAQAQNFLSSEQSYLVESSAVKFDNYSVMPNLYSQGPIDIITKCDSQIAAAFLAQFADLGNTETGARSVGEIHLSVFRRAAINLCDLISGVVSGPDRRAAGTIGRLIQWNYGPMDPSKLPRLTHLGLDTDDLAESMGMLPGLVQSGLLTPDDELERALRQRLGAGDLPEDAIRTPRERAASARTGNANAATLAEELLRRRKNG